VPPRVQISIANAPELPVSNRTTNFASCATTEGEKAINVEVGSKKQGVDRQRKE
jgi:hypothetical protein